MRLFDVSTAQPVANADVSVYSDNGLRCFTQPCPTDGKTWNGHSDSRGYVAVPTSFLNWETGVSTSLHGDGDLDPEAPRDSEGALIVELFPESFGSGGPIDIGVSDFKIMDVGTRRAVINAPVRFTLGAQSIDTTTNALGYAFIPAEQVMKVMAAEQRITISSPGYRRKSFSEVGARYVVWLARE